MVQQAQRRFAKFMAACFDQGNDGGEGGDDGSGSGNGCRRRRGGSGHSRRPAATVADRQQRRRSSTSSSSSSDDGDGGAIGGGVEQPASVTGISGQIAAIGDRAAQLQRAQIHAAAVAAAEAAAAMSVHQGQMHAALQQQQNAHPEVAEAAAMETTAIASVLGELPLTAADLRRWVGAAVTEAVGATTEAQERRWQAQLASPETTRLHVFPATDQISF